ncbi:polyhydroxyalkanoate synthesis repressor PhaR [Roseospira visakhapatnamensis]|uniref:Polyhydroxyalkanoate synthesis repressor PhaR n=1 Tax=Roseospira visakhapatnamensis TaxID=390880 RepID=A0A7W6RBG5_9PROT|nr:polyhydroxyalkanoate synthesis repressor PhaR [Roseospira visakhapatnamensis]MBB4265051.1 polyhydroxyalkanoate synthesis repressor PhaR [Roseospira visakhapatnamensis]
MTEKTGVGRARRGENDPIIIKKYANRRLYNTATSSYVTLDLLSQMVKEQTDFVVYDAKSGEDITRSVLTQIIVEEESKAEQTMLPINFLRHIISFYGDSLGSVVPQYLDHSMQAFARNQEQMRLVMQNAFDGLFPIQKMEEVNKQNMAFFESAMKMFAPFEGNPMMPGFPPGRPATGASEPRSASVEADARRAAGDAEDVQAMKRQMAEMQRKLDRLMSERDRAGGDDAQAGDPGGGKGSKTGESGNGVGTGADPASRASGS